MRTTLSDAELERYREDGFVALPDFLDAAEIDGLEQACRDLVDAGGSIGNPTNGLDHFMNPFQVSDAIRAFSTSAALAEISAQLEGIRDIRLYQDMVAVKPAWGGPTGFHMDVPRISFTADHAVSYWFPLVDVDESNGCLYYLPGAHKERRADAHGAYQVTELGEVDESWTRMVPVAVPLPRGGVVVHEGYAPHGTSVNMTPFDRAAFVVTHMPADATFDGHANLIQPGELPIGAPLDDESRFPTILR